MSAARANPRSSSAFSTLAFLLFALAQTSSLLHGLVRHATCAEHGELVEVTATDAAHEHAAPSSWHDVDTLLARGLGADDDHAHCPLSLNPGTAAPLGVQPTSLELAALEVPASVLGALDSGVVVVSRVLVFFIAPKQGPPAQPSPSLRSV
ncbi:MAG: hypothetical protein Q8O67_19820 [Deltaproteobacteria bacterium]|nr:hypothetical protein [Deltaproteobacteria bacterium]